MTGMLSKWHATPSQNAGQGIPSTQACHGNRRYGDVDGDGHVQCHSTKTPENLDHETKPNNPAFDVAQCLWQEVKEGHANDERAEGHEVRQIVNASLAQDMEERSTNGQQKNEHGTIIAAKVPRFS